MIMTDIMPMDDFWGKMGSPVIALLLEVLLMDLSASPGGIDFDSAEKLCCKVVWVRGLDQGHQ